MVPIGQLLKYLTALNPQTSPVRLALHNYLNHFHRAEQKLTADLLNQFFCHCLEYPHWQQDKVPLGREISQLLENLLAQLPEGSSQGLHLSQIRWPQEIQVIEIESFSDFSEAVHNFLSIVYVHGEKFRLVSDHQKKLMAVILFPEGPIRVRCFDRKFTIRGGILEPLRTDLSLGYNSRLELSQAMPHRLELGPYTCAQFEMVDGEVVGSAVRGYLFQKYQDFRGGPLTSHPKLFYSVKRLEQHFVDRRTDPFYLELTESIERASNLLKMGDDNGLTIAPHILSQAEQAFEQVFVGDKLLELLIRDLQNLWQNKNPQNLRTRSV